MCINCDSGGVVKKYLFKDGAWQDGITTTSAGGVTYSSSGMKITANGYFSVPYVESGKTVYVKMRFTSAGAYNSIGTHASMTASYNTTTGKIQIGASASYGTDLNVDYIYGIPSENVVSGAFAATVMISEIWVD